MIGLFLALGPGWGEAWAQGYSFATLAGTAGVSGSGDSDSNTPSFSSPRGVAVDAAGNIYVADYDNTTIRRISPTGEVTTVAGVAGARGSTDGKLSEARFTEATGLIVDPAGNVAVAGTNIRKIDAAGNVTTLPALADSLASDGQGGYFATHKTTNVVVRVSAAGVTSTFAGAAFFTPFLFANAGDVRKEEDGPASQARFLTPNGLAVDRSGNVYVADTLGQTIRKITPGGNVSTLAGTSYVLPQFLGGEVNTSGSADGRGIVARFKGPTGLAIDAAGNLYVADTGNHTIRRVSPDGDVTTVAGTAGSSGTADGAGGAARFNAPQGIAVDGSGNVIVADTVNHTIRKISPAGLVTTLAGQAGRSGSSDTSGGLGRFKSPAGIALDRGGNLLVADAGNNSVRSVSRNGSVTTVAGVSGRSGFVDGVPGAARFGAPVGVTGDRDGNIFVADSPNSAIRGIAPDGRVSTVFREPSNSPGPGPFSSLAIDSHGTLHAASLNTVYRISAEGGVQHLAGFGIGGEDGQGRDARFRNIIGLAMDDNDTLYAADTDNHTIRKITSDGTVTTLAGLAGIRGSADGSGSQARFNGPRGIAVDANRNVFVADTENHIIRKITPQGVVLTIAGTVGISGSAEGGSGVLRFNRPSGLAVARDGTLFVSDTGNHTIRISTSAAEPIFIVRAPQSQVLPAGSQALLSVTATGSDVTYQWKKNGFPISGATSATFIIPSLTAVEIGLYSVVVTNAGGSVESAVALVTLQSTETVAPATGAASRLVNISIRGLVQIGSRLTAGFVVRGGQRKNLLTRAVGPTLAAFGVDRPLAYPNLQVIAQDRSNPSYGGYGWGPNIDTLIATFARVGAFPLPYGSTDAVLLTLLPAGAYSADVRGLDLGTGVALIEVYDADTTQSATRLINLSALGYVGPGTNSLVPGFVIAGGTPKRLLIRAVGPGLAPFSVANRLADPELAVVPAGQSLAVARNDNWDGSVEVSEAFVLAGAFPLARGSLDAAVVVQLSPGGYTLAVSNRENSSGTVLVEIYDLDP